MNYRKPEIIHLGDAASTIQNTLMKDPLGDVFDSSDPLLPINPAYDLDE